jgi:flagellar protein FliO/FliZ
MPALTFILAFVAVLALIGVAAWLVRRFAGNRLGANPNRSRMPRLAVIDAAAVDGRRRLVLVRRDNVEHLLMIGGPTDIVVEPNIVRAISARDQAPQRPAGLGTELPPRISPLPDAGNWGDGDGSRDFSRELPRPDSFDHPEPQMPEPPSRQTRPSFAEELRRPPVPPAPQERRADPLTGFTPEPLAGRPEPRPELRGEPMPSRVTSRNEPAMPRSPRLSDPPKIPPIRTAERPVAPPPPPAPPLMPTASPAPPAPSALSSADQNLAEMAQRLEAALRRPAADPNEPRVGAPPVAPEPPASRPVPRSEMPVAPPVATPPAPAPTPVKSGFENLEDEMASLLGRPKTPS